MLLLFLLMIFLGTDGEAELRWWRSVTDGDATMGVGVGTDETFGDCRALAQLAITTGTLDVGPALEDRPSSPLLLFPVSISQTIKQDVNDDITSDASQLNLNGMKKGLQLNCCNILGPHYNCSKRGFCFCFIFPVRSLPHFSKHYPPPRFFTGLVISAVSPVHKLHNVRTENSGEMEKEEHRQSLFPNGRTTGRCLSVRKFCRTTKV